MITYAIKVAITFRLKTDYIQGFALILFSAVLSYEKEVIVIIFLNFCSKTCVKVVDFLRFWTYYYSVANIVTL